MKVLVFSHIKNENTSLDFYPHLNLLITGYLSTFLISWLNCNIYWYAYIKKRLTLINYIL